jgi:hypothetical protein
MIAKREQTSEPASTATEAASSLWSVWRQGDDGNPFQIESHLTEAEARRRVSHYESLGHKQFYWAQQELTPKPPPQ